MSRQVVTQRKVHNACYRELRLMRFQIKRAKQAQRVRHACRSKGGIASASRSNQPRRDLYMPKTRDNAGIAFDSVFKNKQ